MPGDKWAEGAMHRAILISVLCMFALEGCDQSGSLRKEVMDESASIVGRNQQFSFANYWSLTMRPESIMPRYERARSSCISDKRLNCKLVNSNASASTSFSYSGSYASLDVLLPHDQVEGFKKDLLAPVGSEADDEIVLQSNTTRADNIEGDSVSAGRKVEQLTAYRDRLVALSKRPNLSIEDNIRLEAEISRVQGDLDTAVKAKADADTRVSRESVHVSLNERMRGPIASVFNRASDIFIQNIANVLAFLIGVIPWLPIIGGAIFLGSWLWRLFQRRKQKNWEAKAS